MTGKSTGFFALTLTLHLLSPVPAVHAAAASSFDRVWSHATLYENSDGRFLQKFALSGRLQADAARFDSSQGEFDDILWRRFRFGFKADLLEDWVLHLEGDWNLNRSSGESYSRLTDAYIAWHPGKEWA